MSIRTPLFATIAVVLASSAMIAPTALAADAGTCTPTTDTTTGALKLTYSPDCQNITVPDTYDGKTVASVEVDKSDTAKRHVQSVDLSQASHIEYVNLPQVDTVTTGKSDKLTTLTINPNASGADSKPTLKTLDVTGYPNLEHLDVELSDLDKLDLSKNPKLQDITVVNHGVDGKATSPDVTLPDTNTVTRLTIPYAQQLDLPESMTDLTDLDLTGGGMDTLPWKQLTKLTSLILPAKLSDLSGLSSPNLKELQAYSPISRDSNGVEYQQTPVSKLDLTKLPDLETLSIPTIMPSIDLTGNTSLKDVSISNPTSGDDAYKTTSLKTADSYPQAESLGLTAGIDKLDLKPWAAINRLHVNDPKIHTVSLKDTPKLTNVQLSPAFLAITDTPETLKTGISDPQTYEDTYTGDSYDLAKTIGGSYDESRIKLSQTEYPLKNGKITGLNGKGTTTINYDWRLDNGKTMFVTLQLTAGKDTPNPEPAPTGSHTVTFDTGDGSKVDTQTVKDGGKAARPTDPTRDGYTFTGWQLDGQAYDFTTPVTRDITLTAAWKQTTAPDKTVTGTHTVTIDPANGTGKTTVTVNDGDKLTRPVTPSRDGYTFTGWQSNGSDFDFDKPITSDLTLTATWKQTTTNGLPLAQTGITAGLIGGITIMLAMIGGAILMLSRRKHHGTTSNID